MKKICFIFLLALLPLATNAEVVEKSGLRYNISTENTTEDLGSLFRGDINGDGKKDVADVVELVISKAKPPTILMPLRQM